MQRPLDLFQQIAYAVVTEPRPETQVARHDAERAAALPLAARAQGRPQQVVDDLLERPPRAPDLELELRRDILFQCQGRSHIMMLTMRHYDVNRTRVLHRCLRTDEEGGPAPRVTVPRWTVDFVFCALLFPTRRSRASPDRSRDIFVVSSFVAAAVMLLFVPLLKRLTLSIRAG